MINSKYLKHINQIRLILNKFEHFRNVVCLRLFEAIYSTQMNVMTKKKSVFRGVNFLNIITNKCGLSPSI